jgi:hypothetical protein
MKFLRSQTTSGAGLKFFEWVFERKKKRKREKKTKLEYFSNIFQNTIYNQGLKLSVNESTEFFEILCFQLQVKGPN